MTTFQLLPGAIEGEDLEHAAEALRTHVPQVPVLVGPDGNPIELPAGLYELLVLVISQLQQGNGVEVLPLHAELTTGEAAELLNVSRPHVVKLLETGKIAFHKVGTHRRIRLADLLTYREARDVRSRDALSEMVAIGEEHDLPY